MTHPVTLDVFSILELLPHRYPFLLIDKVLNIIPNDSIVAVKNVSINESFFEGHFPDRPIMPGVLLLEAMAQTVCVLGAYSQTTKKFVSSKALYVLSKIDKAVFKASVLPGDQILIEARCQWTRGAFIRCQAHATVNGNVVCTAEITGKQRIFSRKKLPL